MTKELSFVSRAVSKFYLNLLHKHAQDVAKIIDDQPNHNPSGVYMLDGDWVRFIKLQSPERLNLDYQRQQFSGKLLCMEFDKATLVDNLLDLDNANVCIIPLYKYNLLMYKFQLSRTAHALKSSNPAANVLLMIWLPGWVQAWM